MKFKPVEYKVLVKPEQTETMYGNIIIPDAARDRQQIAQDKGEIVAVGGSCFEDWGPPVPKVGDKILFSKYAGYRFFDRDANPNTEYRVVNDKDITMILEESEEKSDE